MCKRNSVLRTVLITIVIMLLVFALFFTIFAFSFTKDLANLCYNYGMNNLSSKLYVFEYNKAKNINYIAKACNINILDNNYTDYISHYETFIADDEYASYISFLNTTNLNNDEVTIIVRSTLINEANYYCNYYIKALLKTNKINKARDMVSTNLFEINNTTPNYTVPATYLLSSLRSLTSDFSWLAQDIEGKGVASDNLLSYYDKLIEYRKTLSSTEINNDVYYINFLRHALVVANDIINIDKVFDIINLDKLNQIQADIEQINIVISNVLERNNE